MCDVLSYKRKKSTISELTEHTEQRVLTEDEIKTHWDIIWVVGQRGVICESLTTSIHISLSIFFARHAVKNMSFVSIPPPECLKKHLVVPHRYMFGPGPSNVPPRILEAGAQPVIGHMHPEIFEVGQQVWDGLKSYDNWDLMLSGSFKVVKFNPTWTTRHKILHVKVYWIKTLF